MMCCKCKTKKVQFIYFCYLKAKTGKSNSSKGNNYFAEHAKSAELK